MSDEETTITLKPEGGLAFVGHQQGRILGEMTGDLLILSRAAISPVISDSTVLSPHFKIGKHEFCEPAYQQILLWAKALHIEAEDVIERLLAKPKDKHDKKCQTKFKDGRIINLGWNIASLPKPGGQCSCVAEFGRTGVLPSYRRSALISSSSLLITCCICVSS